MNKIQLSIVIVNWNAWRVLKPCLKSLFDADLGSLRWEVIVVDNASSDGSSQYIREEFPAVRLLAENKNLGYAAGNNRGLAEALGEAILLLNPDTEVSAEALLGSLGLLHERGAYGCIACRLVSPDGHTQQSVRDFPTAANTLFDALGLARIFRGHSASQYRLPEFDYTQEQPCPQAMGTYLLFRRAALEAVSNWPEVFDPQFPIFFNDVDLAKRLLEGGYPTLYSPQDSVVHHGGFSTKQVRKDMIWESHRSLGRYLNKHRLTRAPGLMRLILNLGALWRAKGYREGFRA